jgi:hypothetical protein
VVCPLLFCVPYYSVPIILPCAPNSKHRPVPKHPPQPAFDHEDPNSTETSRSELHISDGLYDLSGNTF